MVGIDSAKLISLGNMPWNKKKISFKSYYKISRHLCEYKVDLLKQPRAENRNPRQKIIQIFL